MPIPKCKQAPLPKLGFVGHFPDRQAMKQGHPKRRFQLAGSYPSFNLPIDWTKNGALNFPVDGNNQYGDCAYAAACHADNTFTGNNGAESNFDTNVIIHDYLQLSPGNTGLNDGQIIGAWRGGLANTPSALIIDALSLNPTNAQEMQAAIYFFGGVYFTLDLPDAWKNNFQNGVIWDAPATPDQNLGHAVWWNGVNGNGYYKLQSWGQSGWITPAGVAVCDPGCFAVFSPRWFNNQAIAPNGLTYGQLRALWVQFGGQSIPPLRVPVDGNVRAFQAVDANTAFVLGTDGNLWLENRGFGTVPPPRVPVDGNVLAFQAVDANTVFVLGTDGNLWLENRGFGTVPPPRVPVDGNVLAFQAVDANTVFVLGTDGNLWLENRGFGTVPPPRVQVDGNVLAFQAVDANTVFVLGTDRNLWLENRGFGTVPPPRVQVDGNVRAFQAVDANTVFVLGTDANLWLENQGFGTVPPPRVHVDENVFSFQGLDANTAFVFDPDGNLWLENQGFGTVPPRRVHVDENVFSFQALDANTAFVLGTDRNLWLERGPF